MMDQQNNPLETMNNSETKKCKYCQIDIPIKATICPNCKKKQSNNTKWIIIGVAVILLVCIIIKATGSSSKDNSSLSNTPDNKTEDSSKQLAVENTPTQNDTGNSTKELKPIDIYSYLQENEFYPYTLTEKAETFLTQHSDLFPCEGDIDKSLIDDKLDYRQILKNANKYGDKLFDISLGLVVQIFEESLGDEEYFTTINVSDGDLQYIVLYNGELNEVFEDSIISLVGLPIGISQFDNLDGGKTRVVCLAGCKVTLISEKNNGNKQQPTPEPTLEPDNSKASNTNNEGKNVDDAHDWIYDGSICGKYYNEDYYYTLEFWTYPSMAFYDEPVASACWVEVYDPSIGDGTRQVYYYTTNDRAWNAQYDVAFIAYPEGGYKNTCILAFYINDNGTIAIDEYNVADNILQFDSAYHKVD